MNPFVNSIPPITLQNITPIYSVVSDEGMGLFFDWEEILDVMEKTCGISVMYHNDLYKAYRTACCKIVDKRIESGFYSTPPILPRLEEFTNGGKFFPCPDMIQEENRRNQLLQTPRVFLVFNEKYFVIVDEVQEVGNHFYHSEGILNAIEFKTETEAQNFVYNLEQRIYYPMSAYLKRTPTFLDNAGSSGNFPRIHLMTTGQQIFSDKFQQFQMQSRQLGVQSSIKSESSEIKKLLSESESKIQK